MVPLSKTVVRHFVDLSELLDTEGPVLQMLYRRILLRVEGLYTNLRDLLRSSIQILRQRFGLPINSIDRKLSLRRSLGMLDAVLGKVRSTHSSQRKDEREEILIQGVSKHQDHAKALA
jgi:hypothetical protein